MRVLKVALALAVVFGLSGVVSAQSLGELAEQQKQKRPGKPTKTITDADLAKPGKSRGTLSMTGTPEPAPEGQGDATAADPAAEVAPAAETTPEEGAEGTPVEQKPLEPAKPKAPPPKSDEQIRAERRAEMQKKIELLQKQLAQHTKLRDEIQSNLNSTLGMYTEGRADMIQMLETEKQKVAQAETEIAQLQEDIRRSSWP